ncbi:MAG TPA: Calx-beta domain-containing protein [Polyangiales bacterium]|nr:Calx-beta domain-containing protein [Polyangiales bacterium]
MANQRMSSSCRTAVNRQQHRAAARLAGRASNPSMSTGAAIAIGLGLSASQAHAETFEVTSPADNGAGTLRAAIDAANIALGADIITFHSSLTGTITLTSGELPIDDTLTIQGPGTTVLSVTGNDASRVMLIAQDDDIEVTISGLKITGGNVNTNGAGIQSGAGRLTLENVELSGNSAAPLTSGQGGGLWVSNAPMGVSIVNSVIKGNAARAGGGIYVGALSGPLDIQSSLITMNDGNVGAGMFIDSPAKPVTIDQSTISSNTASGEGGGIRVGTPGTDGTLTIRSSSVSGNSSSLGGALAIEATDAPTVIESSTFAGNSAANGGAIYCYQCDPMTVRNSTIAGNTSPGNGALLIQDGLVTLSHSIVADNTALNNKDLVGMFTASYSLIESPSTSTITNGGGNVLSQDPQLGTLQDNGGSTFTKLPAATSAAIDAGDLAIASPPTYDQRGRQRVVNGRIDIGAVERNSGTLQCSAASVSLGETAGSVTVTVNRTGGTDGDISVSYATANGTAVAPDDYTSASGTLQWSNGDGDAKTFQVSVLDDQRAESDETFTASLSSPSGTSLGAPSSITVTVTDSDGAPSISAITDQTVTAGGSTSPITFTVGDSDDSAGSLTLSAASSNQLVIANAGVTFGGSAENRTLTIAALTGGGGESNVTISVSDGTNITTRSFKVTVTAVPGSAVDAGVTPEPATDSGTSEMNVDAGLVPGGEQPDAAPEEQVDAAADSGSYSGSDGSDDSSAGSSGGSSDSACGCNIPGRNPALPKPLFASLLGVAGLVFRRRLRSTRSMRSMRSINRS